MTPAQGRRIDEKRALAEMRARNEAREINIAAKAMGLGLAGMTQARWDLLTQPERIALEDKSGLTPQLMGYLGCRVEVVDDYGDKRRFWVGRSTGWRPCHIERKMRTSSGGSSAEKHYQSVKMIISATNGRVNR